MPKKLLFIYNPRSGKGSIKNKLLEIIDIFTKAQYEVTAYPTQAPKDAFDMARNRAGEFELIVCCGGDGTLDEVVTGLCQSEYQIPVGYIPAGSTNDFANSLMIPKNAIKAAQCIVQGDFRFVDVGKFNNDNFIYIAAFGLFTDVAYETDQDMKNILGHVAYVLEGMQRIFNIRSYHMKVVCKEETFEGEFIFGMVTNSTSVGGFKHLTGKNVLLDDGLFEVTFIRKPRNPIEMQEIITSLLLAEDKTDMIESFKTDKLSIICEEKISWTLDGEFGGEYASVDIENLKHALQIAVDSKKDTQQIEKKE